MRVSILYFDKSVSYLAKIYQYQNGDFTSEYILLLFRSPAKGFLTQPNFRPTIYVGILRGYFHIAKSAIGSLNSYGFATFIGNMSYLYYHYQIRPKLPKVHQARAICLGKLLVVIFVNILFLLAVRASNTGI
jgi:hypothetical protein